PGGPGTRARGAHRREPVSRRRAASSAGGVPRGRRRPVRLLHAGPDRGRDRPAGPGPRSLRGDGSRGPLGEPVPLHRLSEDPRRGPPGGRADGAMTKLLIEACEVVVTMDDAGTEIPGGSIRLEDGVITWVGSSGERPAAAEGTETLDGRGTVA